MSHVSREHREARQGHRAGVFWLTGLSGAGKTTLATRAVETLFFEGWNTFLLDGDALRRGLNSDLGFSPDARHENVRRAAEVAALLAEAGHVVLAAFISPYVEDRERVRQVCGHLFHEIHVQADVEACRRRDPRGLYKRAFAGEIPNFTGVSAPYEPPAAPALAIDTTRSSIDESVAQLLAHIRAHAGHVTTD